MNRCGSCENCRKLEQIKRRVLACCNPPFSHIDQDVVDVWNQELDRLLCLGEEDTGIYDTCPKHGRWRVGDRMGGLFIATCPVCNEEEE